MNLPARFSTCFALHLWVLWLGLMVKELRADDVPVAPIIPVKIAGDRDAYLLKNERVQVWVVPDLGGVADIRFLNSTNLLSSVLRSDPVPAAQREILQKATPKVEGIELPVWGKRAWKNADGSQVAMITRTYGAPLHLRVMHTVRLEPNANTVEMEWRYTALSPSQHARVPFLTLQTSNTSSWIWPQKNGTTPCPGFVQDPAPPEKNTQLTQVYSLHNDTLCAWTFQWLDGTEDAAKATGTIVASERKRLTKTSSLTVRESKPSKLVPQGWTRQVFLTLELHALPRADAQLCELLRP